MGTGKLGDKSAETGSRDRIGGTGQLERTVGTGQRWQAGMAGMIRLDGSKRQDTTAGTGQLRQDNQDWTTMAGQPGNDS
jgi:hypothetical protein